MKGRSFNPGFFIPIERVEVRAGGQYCNSLKNLLKPVLFPPDKND
jgi:hypothetical protein